MDDRSALPGRGCLNGQRGQPRPVAGRDDDREPWSPVFVTARGTALQQPGLDPCAASCYKGFRQCEHLTNLVVRAVRKMDPLPPSRLPLRDSAAGPTTPTNTTAIRGRLQGFLGAKTKAVILNVAHVVAVPDTEHAESARWLMALSMESRLLRWIACSDFGSSKPRSRGPRIPPPPFGGRQWTTTGPPLVPFRRLHDAQGRSAGDFLTTVPR